MLWGVSSITVLSWEYWWGATNYPAHLRMSRNATPLLSIKQVPLSHTATQRGAPKQSIPLSIIFWFITILLYFSIPPSFLPLFTLIEFLNFRHKKSGASNDELVQFDSVWILTLFCQTKFYYLTGKTYPAQLRPSQGQKETRISNVGSSISSSGRYMNACMLTSSP